MFSLITHAPTHNRVKRQPNSLQDLRFGNGPFTPRSPCYTVASSLPRGSPIPGSAKFEYNSTINGSEGFEVGYPHYTLPAEVDNIWRFAILYTLHIVLQWHILEPYTHISVDIKDHPYSRRKKAYLLVPPTDAMHTPKFHRENFHE